MRVQQVVVGQVRRLPEQEQRREADPLERRRLPRHLAVGGDDRALAVAVAKAPVVVGEQVRDELLLDELPRRRRQHALLVAAVDPFLEGDVGTVSAGVLGRGDTDVRRDPDRRIEQDEPLDALRRGRRRLVRDPAAERVAEPGRRPGRRSLEHVGDVLLQIPGRLPRRAAVSAQVEGDDVETARQTIRELLEVPPVARDAVQADQRRQTLVAPLVPGEAQVVVGVSGPETSSVRRVSASLTRLQTTTPVLSIRKVPRTEAPRVSSKTPYARAASPCGQKSEPSV